MKNAPMRFAGMSFHHNPHKLSIENEHHIRSIYSPTAVPDSLYLNRKPCVISGEGELYGADCVEQYLRLERLCRAHQRGKLMLPRMPAMYAYLRELRLLSEPQENILTFRFAFTEARSPRLHGSCELCYNTESDGETLWDIGYRYGIPIERLVSLNPQIPHIDELRRGERVKLS